MADIIREKFTTDSMTGKKIIFECHEEFSVVLEESIGGHYWQFRYCYIVRRNSDGKLFQTIYGKSNRGDCRETETFEFVEVFPRKVEVTKYV